MAASDRTRQRRRRASAVARSSLHRSRAFPRSSAFRCSRAVARSTFCCSRAVARSSFRCSRAVARSQGHPVVGVGAGAAGVAQAVVRSLGDELGRTSQATTLDTDGRHPDTAATIPARRQPQSPGAAAHRLGAATQSPSDFRQGRASGPELAEKRQFIRTPPDEFTNSCGLVMFYSLKTSLNRHCHPRCFMIFQSYLPIRDRFNKKSCQSYLDML